MMCVLMEFECHEIVVLIGVTDANMYFLQFFLNIFIFNFLAFLFSLNFKTMF
jgi:hypothetical protein